MRDYERTTASHGVVERRTVVITVAGNMPTFGNVLMSYVYMNTISITQVQLPMLGRMHLYVLTTNGPRVG